jgi:3-oxoacyl-[acyl-carrier-protein] synthase-3
LPTTCAAFDFNLGCSGYVYGLSIAQAMIQTGHSKRALLLTGETYSKWFDPHNFSVASIFGDAGTATIIDSEQSDTCFIGPFAYGTDGSGANRLIVGGSCARKVNNDPYLKLIPEGENKTKLFMDGPEIFAFTTRKIPSAIRQFLQKNQYTLDDFNWIIFHQANKFMLDCLRKQCHIPEEKFIVMLKDTGNTVSNSIPIVLSEMQHKMMLKTGDRLLLVGFGVGYSWSICSITWK